MFFVFTNATCVEQTMFGNRNVKQTAQGEVRIQLFLKANLLLIISVNIEYCIINISNIICNCKQTVNNSFKFGIFKFQSVLATSIFLTNLLPQDII